MNNARFVIIASLLLVIVLVTGCGRKTAPVYSEKQSVNRTEEGNN